MALKTGDSASAFSLKGVDGKSHSVADFAKRKILVVIFTCNHCPYAQAYQERVKAVQQEYGEKGVQIVAINSNDSRNYPQDSFENMVKRARDVRFNYPYLRDESQQVARAYGAEVTPDVFVFDQKRRLRYRGRIDDNWEEPDNVTVHDLRNALDELLAGKDISRPVSRAIGCSIKWKQP